MSSPPGGNPLSGKMARYLAQKRGELNEDSATKVQNAFRGVKARIDVGKRLQWNRCCVKMLVFVVIPTALAVSLYLLLMTIRCIVPVFPYPIECEAMWKSAPAASSTWRQAIKCCDDQQVSIALPRGAEYHDLVALQWWSDNKRYISYTRLEGLRDKQATFAVPWNLVGKGGCLPKPTRTCQYGAKVEIEIAAVHLECDHHIDAMEDGECNAPIEWSWGAVPFTVPRDSKRVDAMDSSRNIIYIASFPPEFSMDVPATLPTSPPRFPIELIGKPGAASDRPTETYPVPVPGVVNEAPMLVATRPQPAQLASLPSAAMLLLVAAVARLGGRQWHALRLL